jgi:signal transduction histidine kinase
VRLAGLADQSVLAQMNVVPPARSGSFLRTACGVFASAICYYIATRIAWSLCFPDSKVSLFFPPHALLVSILLLVPTRQWWAYTLAAAGAHFIATQQAHWPPLYALHCEAFDAVQNVAAAAGIRLLIKSPLKALTLRDAVIFILIAVVLVPFGTAFWGAALTVFHGFGTRYWIEWRNLGISNAVTTVVLVPALLLGAHYVFVRRPKVPRQRALEAVLVAACMVAVGTFVFDKTPAGPGASPSLLYLCIPPLIWAALRFGLGGISAAMLIITFQAIWGTMRGHGPFLDEAPADNALALQLFLLVTATPLMLLAVVIEEERRSRELAAHERAQLEHVARVATLGELTATLTHELKQPLNAIQVNASLAARLLDAPQPDPQELRTTLADIGEITQRAGEMIQGMRDMLKRDTPGLANVDLNALIRSVGRIVQSDALRLGVTMQLDLSPGVLPLMGDSVQLQQVFLNLLLNAFGAMSAPESRARRLIVRTKSINASCLLVEVTDSGTGIPPEKIESIFDPFITTKPDGLGMGLAICRSIIERHGGKLWAANNPERGATFSITLPVTNETRIEGHPQALKTNSIASK